MDELGQIVKDYLNEKDTDYAIMINGDWGCGKSYYIWHGFQDTVTSVEYKGISTFKDELHIKLLKYAISFHDTVFKKEKPQKKIDEKKFYPFYVSLYGVSSVADFNAKVADGVHDWAAMGGQLLKAFISSRTGYDLPISFKTIIPYNAVLVFDDLERICTDKISPIEVLGLINAFAEHQNRKVIIVCNEEAFKKKDNDGNVSLDLDAEYQKYKEKTIRFTYTCEADIPTLYREFATKHKSKDYGAYMLDNTELVLALFSRGGKKNIRTLKFFMDIYSKLFEKVYPEFQDVYMTEIARQLLISTLIYVLEYKNGAKVEDLTNLRQQFILDTTEWLNKYLPEQKKEEKKENKDEYDIAVVRARYNPYYDEMVQIPWLIKYISTGALPIEEAKLFIQSQEAALKRQEKSPAVQALLKLKGFSTINDEDVKPTYDAVCGFIEANQYRLYELLDAYSTFVKYVISGISDIKLTIRKDRLFKNALKKCVQQQVYDPTFEMSAVQWESRAMSIPEVKRYYEMRNYAKVLNENVSMQEYKSALDELYELIENGTEVEGLDSYRFDKKKRIPLRKLDWDRVLKAIHTVPNPKAVSAILCIESLLVNDYTTWSEEEYDALRVFEQKVTEVVKGETRIRKIYMSELVDTIKSFLQNKTGR